MTITELVLAGACIILLIACGILLKSNRKTRQKLVQAEEKRMQLQRYLDRKKADKSPKNDINWGR